MFSFSFVCTFIHFIIFLSTHQTPENISEVETTATAHTGEAFAKAKNSIPFFGGKFTPV
jgi:hypothetical protein